MAKVKTADLIGVALDWAVARAGDDLISQTGFYRLYDGRLLDELDCSTHSPSTDWSLGGPIIDREGISVVRCDDDSGRDSNGFCTDERIRVWCATGGEHCVETSTEHQHHDAMYQIYAAYVMHGPSALIAAMRYYVASKLGADIEIPEDIAATQRD